jgi:hypothetical protein
MRRTRSTSSIEARKSINSASTDLLDAAEGLITLPRDASQALGLTQQRTRRPSSRYGGGPFRVLSSPVPSAESLFFLTLISIDNFLFFDGAKKHRGVPADLVLDRSLDYPVLPSRVSSSTLPNFFVILILITSSFYLSSGDSSDEDDQDESEDSLSSSSSDVDDFADDDNDDLDENPDENDDDGTAANLDEKGAPLEENATLDRGLPFQHLSHVDRDAEARLLELAYVPVFEPTLPEVNIGLLGAP